MRLILNGVNIKKVYESGQCFSICNIGNEYWCVGTDTACVVRPLDNDSSELFCKEEFIPYWKNFFTRDLDYNIIRSHYLRDFPEEITTNIVNMSKGLVLLYQEHLFCLLSFITSQRKTVPAIRTAMNKFLFEYGNKQPIEELVDWYILSQIRVSHVCTIPTIEQLKQKVTVERLTELGFGYRAQYIYDAIINFEDEKSYWSFSDEEVLTKLMSYNGVGVKIANCVALYSLGRTSLYPRDVWIKRFEDKFYGGYFNEEKCISYAGVAQLWQYYYMLNSRR